LGHDALYQGNREVERSALQIASLKSRKNTSFESIKRPEYHTPWISRTFSETLLYVIPIPQLFSKMEYGVEVKQADLRRLLNLQGLNRREEPELSELLDQYQKRSDDEVTDISVLKLQSSCGQCR
jgi:hypothetical protein